METLELLGVALGLATLAGINLYLTVFLSGLAIQQGWITLHSQYEQLAVLGDPVIVTVAGILFALEFFADKVPWVDSLWDSVHTFIRPVGGAMLAVTALGDSSPVYDVIVGLLAGGMAFTAHGAKAGTRLLVNASPEPFSNVGLSLVEDVTVLGGLALIYSHPVVALVLAVLAVGVAVWLAPRIFGAARAMLWFAWRRVCGGSDSTEFSGPPQLPPDLEIALTQARGDEPDVEWAAPCVSGRGPNLRGNVFGWLLLTDGLNGGLDFVRNRGGSPRVQAIPTASRKAAHTPGFVADRVTIYGPADGTKHVFQFDRSRRALAAELARRINASRGEARLETPVAAV